MRQDKVSRLVRATRTVAAEYFENENIPEAVEAVRGLRARAFHGHLVEELLTFAFEHPDGLEKAMDLLEGLVESNLLSQSSVSQGFAFVEPTLEDLKLDIPNALQLLGSYHDEAAKRKLVSE